MKPIERLYYYFEIEGVNISSLEKEYNVPTGHFNKIKTRKGGITESTLLLIFEMFPDLNTIWLFTGKGKVKLSEQKASSKEVAIQENIKLEKELKELKITLDVILNRNKDSSNDLENLKVIVSNLGDRMALLEDSLNAD